MTIDDKLISYLEDASSLILSSDEKTRMKKDLQIILDSMAPLVGLDTHGVSECIYPLDQVNDFRDDEALPSLDRCLILKNALVKNDEFFIAPKTVD
jgi:aspartyl-tRNA(Asn)/glutamyl-tRNA(Gln) amidotransferase subunit C